MPQTQSQIKNILRDKDIRLRKSLGQNLLIDSNIVRLITRACELNKKDIVFEIGAGTGCLTESLAQQTKTVFAIDIDEKMMDIAKNNLRDFENIHWIRADVLKLDFKSYLRECKGHPIKIVGNLPYYITTPILMRFLEEKFPFERMVITIQKEVAERIIAKPGTKEYGVLTLMVQYRCKTELVKTISRTCFFPVPDVDSAILRLIPHSIPPVDVQNEDLFFALIRAAFNQRRKTLVNSLDAINETTKISKEQLTGILDQTNISPQIRGEKLTMEDFARLTNRLIKM